MDKSMRWLLWSATSTAILLVLLATIAMRFEAAKTFNEILPSIQSNLAIEKSVTESFALLNQFLTSHDEQFASARRQIWRDQVLQQINQIKDLTLTDSLKKISDWQEQIEQIGNTPNNNPLRLAYETDASTTYNSIIATMSQLKIAMTELNDDKITPHLAHLSTLLNGVDKLFTQSDNKQVADLSHQLRQYWQTILPVAEQVRQWKRRYNAEIQRKVIVLLLDMSKYKTKTEFMLDKVNTESTNLSDYWLENYAEPLHRALLTQFGSFNQQLNDSLLSQKNKITEYFVATAFALFILFAVTIGMLYFQRRQIKKHYLQPFSEFMGELNQYADEELSTELDLQFDDDNPSVDSVRLNQAFHSILGLVESKQFEITSLKVENQQLHQENDTTKSLVEGLSSYMEKETTLQGVAQQGVEFLRILFGAEYGMLYVVDPRQKWLIRYGAIGIEAAQENLSQLPINEGSLGECALSKTMLHKHEESGEKLFIPITCQDTLRGVIELGNHGEIVSKHLSYMPVLLHILAMAIDLTHNK